MPGPGPSRWSQSAPRRSERRDRRLAAYAPAERFTTPPSFGGQPVRGPACSSPGPLTRHTHYHRFLGMLRRRKPDALQGTLDLLVLKTLSRGPHHGYGIAEDIESISDDMLRVEEGSLYPALHR